MKFPKFHKKPLIASLAATVAILGGGAAYAFFTSSGSGAGSAHTGAAASLTISQVGAGYDSLIPSNNYSQDQTFGGAGISEFGNDITLSTPAAPELVSVVVAMDNWGPQINNLPITFTITGTPGGAPLTDTETYSFAPAPNSDTPSETNITFHFASQNAFVDQSLVYGISYDSNASDTPNGSALNVALSNSDSDLSVGTDTNPGTVWLDTSYSTIGDDFPACTYAPPFTTGTFEQVTTDCGPYAVGNPGAYGTPAQVQAGSDDIPAVEFNVVGGTTSLLYPGGPSQPVDFAITNAGSSSVHVATVTTTVTNVTTNTIAGDEACSATMYPLTDPVVTVDANIPPGTTIFSPSGTSIKMTDDGNNQDNCENAVVSLGFTSN